MYGALKIVFKICLFTKRKWTKIPPKQKREGYGILEPVHYVCSKMVYSETFVHKYGELQNYPACWMHLIRTLQVVRMSININMKKTNECLDVKLNILINKKPEVS